MTRRTSATGGQGRGCRSHCDHRRMTFLVAGVTMVFSIATCGIVVTDLLNVNRYHESVEADVYETNNVYYQWYQRKSDSYRAWTQSSETENGTSAGRGLGIEHLLWELNVAKVLYTALVCTLVLLTISSISLVKGVVQGRPSLIATWLSIAATVIIYEATLIGREWGMLGLHTWLKIKFGAFICLAVFELACARYVFKSFSTARSRTIQRARRSALFDPRNPDRTIFAIARRLEERQAAPHEVFKLPSYEEATSPLPGGHPTGGGEPPLYQLPEEPPPPPYQPPVEPPPPSYDSSLFTRV